MRVKEGDNGRGLESGWRRKNGIQLEDNKELELMERGKRWDGRRWRGAG